jgi:hypothetical protein
MVSGAASEDTRLEPPHPFHHSRQQKRALDDPLQAPATLFQLGRVRHFRIGSDARPDTSRRRKAGKARIA